VDFESSHDLEKRFSYSALADLGNLTGSEDCSSVRRESALRFSPSGSSVSVLS